MGRWPHACTGWRTGSKRPCSRSSLRARAQASSGARTSRTSGLLTNQEVFLGVSEIDDCQGVWIVLGGDSPDSAGVVAEDHLDGAWGKQLRSASRRMRWAKVDGFGSVSRLTVLSMAAADMTLSRDCRLVGRVAFLGGPDGEQLGLMRRGRPIGLLPARPTVSLGLTGTPVPSTER